MRVRLLLLAFSMLLAGCASTPDANPTPRSNDSTTTGGTPIPMSATVELGESNPAGAPLPGQTGAGMYLKATGMDALRVGVPVNLTIKNAGTQVHDLVIPDLAVKSGDVAAGKSVTIIFTPSKAGTFDMWCDKTPPDPSGQGVGSHRSSGMAGKVTVKPAA